MSAHQEHSHHDGHDDHHVDSHADHGSFKSYVIGFVLAVILTAIPFWLVMGNVIEKSSTTGLVLLGLAVVQIVVHMIYFLHMNTKSEGGWNMLALIFTVMLVFIMLAGSLWVMYHLNHNMMPGMMHETVPESLQHAVPAMQGGAHNMQHSMQDM
ncbi:MAG: cytochrome o ubiquinol oxidase subunit IV [Glaciimonas sp.]|nr:cytochrome o ubiquinol oxidase subunit IV [Glaciimonas sp.]